ncbi:MAG: hypothetical protein AB2417_02490 [Clostridiaceae bacterium]
METISIALLCSIIGAVIALITFSKNRDKDLKKDTKEETIMSTRLDYIAKGVDDIRLDMKAQDRKMQDFGERLIVIEQSTKSAHHRIDGLEKEGV